MRLFFYENVVMQIHVSYHQAAGSSLASIAMGQSEQTKGPG